MSDFTWTPRVGEAIKRRNDPDAPRHTVTAVRGSGPACTVLIDGNMRRWWDRDVFESAEPRSTQPVMASDEAQLNDALAGEDDEPSVSE